MKGQGCANTPATDVVNRGQHIATRLLAARAQRLASLVASAANNWAAVAAGLAELPDSAQQPVDAQTLVGIVDDLLLAADVVTGQL